MDESVPDKARGRVVGSSGAVYLAVLLASMLGACALADVAGARLVVGIGAAVSVAGLVTVYRLVRPVAVLEPVAS